MDSENNWVVIGRFGRPQGLKGFVRVISFTEPQHNVVSYVPWYTKIDGAWQPITLLDVEQNNKYVIVRVDGYQQREQVSLLTNHDIAIQRDKLSKLPPGEYYWHDLRGMRVVTQEGLALGVVADIIATGSNDVLVVVGEKRHLIPYLLGDYVLHIDESQRQMTVDWDEAF